MLAGRGPRVDRQQQQPSRWRLLQSEHMLLLAPSRSPAEGGKERLLLQLMSLLLPHCLFVWYVHERVCLSLLLRSSSIHPSTACHVATYFETAHVCAMPVIVVGRGDKPELLMPNDDVSRLFCARAREREINLSPSLHEVRPQTLLPCATHNMLMWG